MYNFLFPRQFAISLLPYWIGDEFMRDKRIGLKSGMTCDQLNYIRSNSINEINNLTQRQLMEFQLIIIK